jgi:hypothetical protein
MKKYLFAFLLCIVTAPVFAVNGGVQTSLTTIDCGDANKEVNEFDHGSQVRVWVAVPSGTRTDDLSYHVSDQGKVLVNPANLRVTACGDGYFFGDIVLPDAKGSVTLVVEHGDGVKVGSDTFQLR